ncbi:unnamed protein product [Rotaria sordida]|uniref:TAFII55 protein conserved region domain-containing protein n=1 Tax=Rotaria sordida TaxID=392033 RepID=A0A815AUL3_9BILA|nr:unnamed protein product [Rotaria sordida]CAF1300255.1 unnamed protein product [Rotaria sordida]CAF1347468.1 unnamed protein product [Rotaria sordida]CAF1385494.1 unnamed protein product [Rotaria sordida]CAF1618068.1 unnamed protein product [Rotaria sordida]
MSTIPTISTRITTKKEKNEEQFELKQQFILRMPSSEYARRLRQLIDYGDENICQRLFIDLNSERRRDRIKFDNTRFKGTLYDLLSITETYKTFYRKTLYKIHDIDQIIVCRLPDDLSSTDDDGNEKKKKEKDKEIKFQ